MFTVLKKFLVLIPCIKFFCRFSVFLQGQQASQMFAVFQIFFHYYSVKSKLNYKMTLIGFALHLYIDCDMIRVEIVGDSV